MDVEKLLETIHTINRLEYGDKLFIEHDMCYIDQPSIFRWFYRRWYKQTTTKTYAFLNNTISYGIDHIILYMTNTLDESSRMLTQDEYNQIHVAMLKMKHTLDILIDTYRDDTQFIPKLIELKIKLNLVKQVRSKLFRRLASYEERDSNHFIDVCLDSDYDYL